MNTRNVGRTNAQIKLVYDPSGSPGFPLERLLEEVGLEMKAFAASAGLIMMKAVMKAEEEYLAGERGTYMTEVNRWSKDRGSVVVGGQRVPVVRQRLRKRTGGAGAEVQLKSYTMFHKADERTRAVYQRMIAGVSCRNYQTTLEEMAQRAGVSRSVVSREIIESTEADLKELCERDLSKLDIRLLVIDGMPLDGLMTIGVLGVDLTGKKHVLGFREGATENADVCKRLFEDLVGRGLKLDRPMLFILDGSKALAKAARDTCGENAVIHRCNFHKRQNLKSHLPKEYHAEYERKLEAVHGMNDYKAARAALISLIKEVERLSIHAARSLEEGFEETLTLHRLGVPDALRKSLATTNLIESTFSFTEKILHNVKRWRNSSQRLRWCSTAFLRAEKQFRRVKGCKSMPVLVSALDYEVRQRKGEELNQVA
jgi:transposase-like protein